MSDTPTKAEPKAAAKSEPKEPARYTCVKACRYQNRLYNVGDPLTVTSPAAIPEHFEKAD